MLELRGNTTRWHEEVLQEASRPSEADRKASIRHAAFVMFAGVSWEPKARFLAPLYCISALPPFEFPATRGSCIQLGPFSTRCSR